MGRPPNTDPAVTRNRILQAAVDLFGENGREGAAIREVARRAEVSMSTVLHHFGSKQGLFDACVNAMLDGLATHQDAMLGVATAASEPRAASDQVVRECFRFARRHQRLLRVITCESVTTGHLPEGGRERVIAPALDRAAGFVSHVAGRSTVDARIAVMSICHIITRFVLTDVDELRTSLALDPAKDEDATYDVIEDHVARNAAVLLWGSLD